MKTAQKDSSGHFRAIWVWLILSLLVPALAPAQLQYGENVWVSYTDFHQVTDFAVGPDRIYVTTQGGVLRYHRYKQVWEAPWVIGRGREESIDLRGAFNVDFLSETNQVAVLTSRGAYLYDPTAQYWTPTSHQFGPVQHVELSQAIFIDLPGTLVSRRNYFQQGMDAIMDGELRRHALGAYADDGWGNWWMGVQGVGVMRLDTKMQRGTLWDLGLFGADVRAMVRGDGWTILAGHNLDKGITLWKPKGGYWDHLEPHYLAGFESSWIVDLTVTGKWLLAATDNGLAQIDLKNGSARTWTLFDGLYSNAVTAVAADKDTVWIACEGGLNVLYLPKGPIKRVELPALRNQPLYRLAVDKQAVWVGGELGLFRLDRGTGEGNYLGSEGGIGGPVFALHSRSDEIWVGRLNGLEVVDKGSLQQTGFPAQAHFGGATVNAIVTSDSLVWVGTNAGLWKYDRSRNRWHQYTELDGLIDLNVTALYLDGDYLLCGTPAGVTRFYWNEEGRID